MEKNVKTGLVVAAVILLGLIVISYFALESQKPKDIKMDYYYLENCGSCEEVSEILKDLEQKYNLNITRYNSKKPGEGYDRWSEMELKSVPCIVLENGERYYRQQVKHGQFEKRLQEITEENNKSIIEGLFSKKDKNNENKK